MISSVTAKRNKLYLTTRPSFLRADSQRGAAESTIACRKQGRVAQLFKYKFTVVSLHKKIKTMSSKRVEKNCFIMLQQV